MKLTCLGKYGPYPKPGCACSGYLLQSGGKNIVIDLGCGTLPRLLKLLAAKDVDALVLSHLHSDHMGDALTLRYALDSAKKLGARTEPLPVYMPAEPSAEAALLASCAMMAPVHIEDGAEFDISGIVTRFARMPHAVPGYAMAFFAEGKKFVYSGDTGYNDSLAGFAGGADLFIIESAFLSKDLPGNAAHISAAQAGFIASGAGAKRTLLTHIFPLYDENEILKEAAGYCPRVSVIGELETYEV